MPTALVTGGAGFIGSHLVKALLARGLGVRVVDNLSTGTLAALAPYVDKIEFIEGSIADRGVCRSACRGIDVVFHLAALPSVPASLEDPFETQLNGEIATLMLLDAAVKSGVKKMIFSASSSAYGRYGLGEISESERLAPASPYAASKLACEHYLAAYGECFPISCISLRYFNVYGNGQIGDGPYSGVISKYLLEMRRGTRPVIFGDGEQTRDFVHVDDVVQANLLAMDYSGKITGLPVNIGCGVPITLKMLVAEINCALGTNLEPVFEQKRAGDVEHSCADIWFARELFGYAPKVSFSEGIRRMIG